MGTNRRNNTDHPLEEFFNIEDGTTETINPDDVDLEIEHTFLVQYDDYDNKDKELESQYQNIMDMSIRAYKTQVATSRQVDPKYRARNEEVAIQYLNIALDALREKTNLKLGRDKITKSHKNTQNNTNGDVITADRNELIKRLTSKNKSESGS